MNWSWSLKRDNVHTGNSRQSRPSRVAPPLAVGSSSTVGGVGLLSQVPHCLRKNGTDNATHLSRSRRIQSGSQIAAPRPDCPPPMTQPTPLRFKSVKSASSGSQERNRRLGASTRNSGFNKGRLLGCPMVAPSQTLAGKRRFSASSLRSTLLSACRKQTSLCQTDLNKWGQREVPFVLQLNG